MEYKITLTEEQEKALETEMMDINEWIQNAIFNRHRRAQDKIVTQSGRGSKFTPKADKEKIIRDLIAENSPLLKSARERQAEMEEELRKNNQ